ncbi:MAG: C45 family autoproteolytic acyltransferase/hydrolase, partial [Planctomycetota bacterium]|nr:C45 family autoproteolytic acyltransferase/hydrolase [Planctomycetota bacterium]
LANSFPELFHCSGILLFGKATKNGEMYHSRILDYMTGTGFQDNAVVMIFQPDEGYNSFITAGFAGLLGSVTGMNDKQIAIGEMGGAGFGQWDGVPMVFLFRRALEESTALEQAVAIFQNNPRTCEYFYVISDGKITDGRALYCIPDKVEVIKPGDNHPALPEPFLPDTLLVTGEDRYLVLRKKVEENYGAIDLVKFIEIMKRPVSMEGNLHNAIFIPNKLKMYLAVAGKPSLPEFQACYQKYYEYDYNELIKYYPQKEKTKMKYKEVPTVRYPPKPDATAQGILPAKETREISTLAYSELKDYLKVYETQPQDVPYKLVHKLRTTDFDMFTLTFDSLINSPSPENNTVYCEYYRSFNGEKKPAVILLDILEASMHVPRLTAYKLATVGINSCIVTLPYYGKRKPKEGKDILSSPAVLPQALTQAVNDIRVASSWLSVRQENSSDVNLCGTSLGGLFGALAAGVDGNFKKVCFVLAGGDLTEIILKQEKAKENLEQMNISGEMLKVLLLPYDPLTYTKRLDNTQVLMINTKDDEIIPATCAEKYYQALKNKEIIWYPGNHTALVDYLPEILDRIRDFFIN